MDKNIMVTVSGGRSSAMMARHIQTHEKYKDYKKVYVFCNTGMERPETIDFLKNIVKYWHIPLVKIEGVFSDIVGVGVSYKIVDFDTLNMNAEPFSGCIMHKTKGAFNGLPNMSAPYCSDSMKTIPSKKLCDDIFGVNNYVKSIGFRLEDMPKRISFPEIKEDKTRIFPLITDFITPISQLDLNVFFDKQPFKLMLHSSLGNCELCYKKSDTNIINTLRHGTRFVDWFRDKENHYNDTFFRGRKSIDDFVKLSELPFTPQFDFPDDKCVCSF